MLTWNNPYIGKVTRQWLSDLSRGGVRVDSLTLPVIYRFLRKSELEHPGGVIYDLALKLGAPEDKAEIAGSGAEMFYSACSAGDDIQDGDTDFYMREIPLAQQLNGQSHLMSLVALRVKDLDHTLIGLPSLTLATMLVGQWKELTRAPWTAETYEQVAIMSAGEQYGFYMKLVAVAAELDEVRSVRLVQWGVSCGTLLQLIEDLRKKDDRLVCFSEDEISGLKECFVEDFKASSNLCGNEVRMYAECLCGLV